MNRAITLKIPPGRGFERYRLWVLKNCVIASISCGLVWALQISFFSFLRCDKYGCCWLAEEAHQSLEVLRSCCQEKLLANELHAS